ncbi:MAG: hypothetical protein FK731_05275 [Asgard group archaeon]|nr:hypothetical protein [Asgard group archaeon]
MVEENKQIQAAVIILIIIGSAFIGGSVYIFNPFEDEIKISNAFFSDENNNKYADTLKLVLKNRANLKVTIDEISITKLGMKLEWTYNESIEINANSKFNVICKTENLSEELHSLDLIEIAIFYKEKILVISVRISIEFSDLAFIYGNNFQDDFIRSQWSHFLFRNLTGYPIHGGFASLSEWLIDRDPLEFDKCLTCMTRNCQFIVLNTSLYNFDNFNLSIDIRRSDNDGVGVILRYNEFEGYPQFYLLWHTLDHPMGDEQYLEEETHLFNWTTNDDIVSFYEITLHYVKGYDAGNGIIGFNWTKLNSTICPISNRWHNWHVALNGSYLSYYFDYSQMLIYDGLLLTNGSIGLASFESSHSCFDNLYLW